MSCSSEQYAKGDHEDHCGQPTRDAQSPRQHRRLPAERRVTQRLARGEQYLEDRETDDQEGTDDDRRVREPVQGRRSFTTRWLTIQQYGGGRDDRFRHGRDEHDAVDA